ncbi:MAG: prepilin peptidase [Acidimicrobiales bacterium]
MSDPVALFLFGLFGLAVGSFLNVLIVRVPAGESLLSPPSKCPLCESPIAPKDNIPVLSWLLLKGRCRHCGEPIPAGYPLVEAGSMVLWLLAAISFPQVAVALPFALLFSVLLALSVIDLELYILPNRITYPSIAASLVAIPLVALLVADDPKQAILGAVLGAVIFAGILGVTLVAWLLLMKKEGMGLGDVKLAVLLGLWLGFLDPILPVIALIASSLIGLVVGVAILLVRRASKPFPFGPWLAIGSVLVIVFAGPILDFYSSTASVELAAASARSASSALHLAR